MEPVRWGRDDTDEQIQEIERIIAAMEPVRWGRDDRPQADDQDGVEERAAMEPVRWGRDDTPRRCRPADRGSRGRNGARPLGTGRPACSTSSRAPAYCRNGARPLGTGRPPGGRSPLWRRPTCRNGARPLGTGRLGVSRVMPHAPGDAAMEPVRWGRDDGLAPTLATGVPGKPQWSPSAGDGTTAREIRAV